MAKRLPADAFDFYFALGAERSYGRVAEKYKVSKRAVTNLATREGWQQRIVDLEAKARAASDRKKVESIEERNDRHLQAFRFVEAKAVNALKEMSLESAMDAVRALALSVHEQRVISGDPSNRTAISLEDTIRQEYRRWLVHDDGANDAGSCDAEETERGDDEDLDSADSSE